MPAFNKSVLQTLEGIIVSASFASSITVFVSRRSPRSINLLALITPSNRYHISNSRPANNKTIAEISKPIIVAQLIEERTAGSGDILVVGRILVSVVVARPVGLVEPHFALINLIEDDTGAFFMHRMVLK